MQITGGFVFSGGLKLIKPPPVTGIPVSGDANLTLGLTVEWSSNTYFYTAGASTLGISGGDYQYDTNNMVWQLFYAHRQIRIPVGSNRWGPIPRQGGNNSLKLRGIVSPDTNNKNSWGSNVETTLGDTVTSVTYSANTLYQTSTTAAITIPANRYFLLGIVGGPFYKTYRKTANNITAVNAGNAIVTVLNEVYVGPWPTGPLVGTPSQLNGNVGTYLKFTSNIYYSGIKFEIV